MTRTERDFRHALQGARQGDPERFAALYRMAAPGLVRYVRVIAPGLPPAGVRDVVSTAWARIIRHLRRLPGNERDFVVRLARIARDETWARADTRPPVDRLRVVTAAGLDTDLAIATLAELPADVAEMVALRTVLGLDVQDTAEVVGRRAGSVRIAVYAGLRRAAGRVGVAGAGAGVGVAACDPWELDRLVDAREAELRARDRPLADLLAALRAPAVEDELIGLDAGRLAYGRAFAFGPAVLLLMLGRRLRALAGRKLAVATVSTMMLGAPAAAAYSGIGPQLSPAGVRTTAGPQLRVPDAALPSGLSVLPTASPAAGQTSGPAREARPAAHRSSSSAGPVAAQAVSRPRPAHPSLGSGHGSPAAPLRHAPATHQAHGPRHAAGHGQGHHDRRHQPRQHWGHRHPHHPTWWWGRWRG